MRAVGYVRVSTDAQAIEGISLEAQEEKIRAYCRAAGLDLEGSGVYADRGISGKRRDNRPGLLAALSDISTNPGALVVYSLSRLARSVPDTIAIGEQLSCAKCDLVSLTEKIDTTSASGKMIFQFLAVLAEFERNQIAERTTAALRQKSSKGERIGQIPYGYRLAADGVTLEPEPNDARLLEVVRDLRAQGLTLRAVADRLNATELRPKNGRAWSHSTVAALLRRTSLDAQSHGHHMAIT